MVCLFDTDGGCNSQNVAALVEDLSQCSDWQSTVGCDMRSVLHRYVLELGAPRVST